MIVSAAPRVQPPVQPTRQVLRDIATHDWAARTKVGDSDLGTVAARALQFSLEGDGVPSARRLVPQTDAAAKLLAGPNGDAIERALRGIAATTDAHDGRTNIGGISLARGMRDFAVNSTVSYLEAPPTSTSAPTWAPDTDVAGSRKELDAALEGGRQVSTMAVAQAPGWINLGPFASRQLLRLAGSSSTAAGDAAMGAWLASLAAHEPHHTITPPSTKDIIKAPFLQDSLPEDLERASRENPYFMLKPLNWIEEGTADVLSTWAGVLPATAAKLGIPSLGALPEPTYPTDLGVIKALRSAAERGGRFTPDERAAVDGFIVQQFGTRPRSDNDRMQMVAMPLTGMRNYPMHVGALHEVLGMAGLDPTNPSDVPRASELLQGARITHVPGRVADAIIEHQQLDPSVRERLRTAIRDIGEHLNGSVDEIGVNTALEQVAKLVESARPTTD